MKIVTPPKSIHKSKIINDEIIVTIPVKKRWFEIIWFLWCLIIITPLLYFFGRVFVLLLLFSVGLYGDVPPDFGDDPNVFGTFGIFFIFSTIFLLTELMLIYCLIWRFAGKEIISANRDLFIVTRNLFGWKTYKAYNTSEISALRISRPTDNWTEMFSGLRRIMGLAGTIAFDYGAKTFRFGDGIDEAEARQIIKKIQSHLSSFLSQFEVDSKIDGEYN
jgi:hypothetical protein